MADRPSKNTQDSHSQQTTENHKEHGQLKDTEIKQQVNPHNLELVRGHYIRQAEQHYSEWQNPSSQQLIHLTVAG
jgi:hypothetical protein